MAELTEKIDIKSMLPEELAEYLRSLGQPAYRAKQLFHWFSAGCGSWDEMTNLPRALRQELSERCTLSAPRVLKKQQSAEDGTIKFLWELQDGNAVETVVMRYHYGNTVCISSQVGCRQGCAFCASTIGGLVRNLTPSEMLDEVLFSEKESGLPVSHIVLMGIGEPLDNFDTVMRFLELINHPEGRNISMRHISLSTCGLTERFDDLAERDLQITLSVSLHAPDDETRSSIMPVNDAYPVERLMQACRYYFDTTGRRISYEYMMARDKTDRPWQAEKLAKLLRGRPGHVNLIPLNEVEESPLSPSKPETVRRFQQALEKRGVTATVRRRLGPDIDAACGQLRRREMKEQG